MFGFCYTKKGGHLGPPHGFMILFFVTPKNLLCLDFVETGVDGFQFVVHFETSVNGFECVEAVEKIFLLHTDCLGVGQAVDVSNSGIEILY